MSKIVIDARESGTSTGRYVDKLLEQLHILKPDHDITVIVKMHREAFVHQIAPVFTVTTTDSKEFTLAEQLDFKREIDALKPDLVHFTMVQQPVLYKGLHVTTMHDLTTVRFKNPDKNPLVYALKQRVYRWVNKRVARTSAAIFTPTRFVADDVTRFTHVDPSKVTVTLEAGDKITEPSVELPELVGKQFIMYVGRPTPHKNLGRLIDAFEKLQADRPELYLVLAGKKDANYGRHAAAVTERHIPNVVFTDFISDGQLRWLYEHCRAYVFPSLSEGFGLPGLEAMAHGAPVVSSDATCLPEIYGDAAAYFNPLDVGDMVQVISEVVDDPILREDLCEKGTQQVKQYSWRRMAEQTLAVYDSILNGK